MTYVKFKNRPFATSFDTMVDELVNGWPSLFNEVADKSGLKNYIPVNITEKANGYQLDVIAPGFDKADFKVNLEGNVLTISAEHKTENKEETDKNIRKEYSYRNFKRSFTIDEKIDATNIGASYINGVLQLNLPKKTEVKEETKEIRIN